MKSFLSALPKAFAALACFTLLCGILYPGIITGISQLCFSHQANGSLIEIDGKTYGSALLGQPFEEENHMWGRIMNIDTTTYKDADGNPLLYATPSNLSPASKEYEKLIEQRVEKIQKANPERKDTPIPVDLVTCSGSGLDPEISPAAAYYQTPRLAKANHISEEQVESIIEKCTQGKFLGLFGEETVNVLKVNLMLDGILEE